MEVYNMSTQTIERTTLSNLIHNEDYCRKVIPFIKPIYFANRDERIVFEEIEKFLEKYNALPTKETLTIGVDSRKDLSCLLYTSPSPRDIMRSRMPSSA